MGEPRPSMVGRTNIYICEKCRYAGVTVHRDDGTAPFAVGCLSPSNCRGMAYSTFYRAVTDLPPIAEWYRPTDEELAGLSDAIKRHVEAGGLLLRRIQTDDQKKMVEEAVRASLLK